MTCQIYFAALLLSFWNGFVVAEDKITFDDHVKPVFQKRCASCHNGGRQSGGLDVTNFTNLMQGGSSGTSIEPGDASGSYLFQLVTHEESPEMPPDGNKIPENEIEVLRRWIDLGALENKGSKAREKKNNVLTMSAAIGVRPEKVAYPMRLPLEPFYRSKRLGVATAIATSPWAPLIAVAGAKQVLLYNSNSMELLGCLPFPEGKPNELKFSRDGSVLVAAGGRHGLVGKVFAWDVKSADRIFEIGDEIDNVLSADLSSNLSWAALGGPQKMLRVYSTHTESLLYEIKKHTDWITAIEFSPDGVLLASADRNGGLHLWESESGNEYLTLAGHAKSVNDISWRSDSNVVATGGDDGVIKLWEVENGRQIKSWNAHKAGVNDLEFTRDGHLVTVGRDSMVKLWKQNGKLIKQFKGLGELGVAVSFSDESQKVVASNLDGDVHVWSKDKDQRIGSLPTNPRSLEKRLRHAEKLVASTKEELEPLVRKLEKVNASVQEIQSDIDSNLQTQERLAQGLEAARKELETFELNAESEKVEREALAAKVSKAELAIPVVKESLAKSMEASKLLPQDSSLQGIVSSLNLKIEELEKQIVDGRQQLLDSQVKLDGFSSKIQEASEVLVVKESNLTAAGQRIEQRRQELAPLQATKQKLDSEVAVLQRSVLRQKQNALRWHNEIEFSKDFAEKSKSLTVANQAVAQKDEELAEARRRLQELQSEVDRIENEKAALDATASEMESQFLQIRERK